MTRVKLDDSEYKEIAIIVDKYKDVELSLENIQKQLEELDQRKTNLLDSLDKIREEENDFFKRIEEKHGEGKLDILTMEYVKIPKDGKGK